MSQRLRICFQAEKRLECFFITHNFCLRPRSVTGGPTWWATCSLHLGAGVFTVTAALYRARNLLSGMAGGLSQWVRTICLECLWWSRSEGVRCKDHNCSSRLSLRNCCCLSNYRVYKEESLLSCESQLNNPLEYLFFARKSFIEQPEILYYIR